MVSLLMCSFLIKVKAQAGITLTRFPKTKIGAPENYVSKEKVSIRWVGTLRV